VTLRSNGRAFARRGSGLRMGTRHGCYVCLSASSRLTAATSCPVTGTVIGAAGIVGEGETPDAIVRRHSKRGAGSSCRSAVGRGPSRCSARRCAGSCVAAIAHPGDCPRACVVVAGVGASALVGLVDPDAMALAVVRLACSVTIRDSGASVAARWLLVAAWLGGVWATATTPNTLSSKSR
jgi:hypothetical protein